MQRTTKRGSLILWSAMILALAPVTALAQSAAFKCPTQKIVVEFSDKSVVTWTGVTGPASCEIVIKPSDGTETRTWFYAPTVNVAAHLSQTWVTQSKGADLWPLTVGKTITSRVDGPNATGAVDNWYYVFKIERAERLTTKAGTWDTFVVSRQEEASRGYKATNRHWFAPEPGVTVKFEYTDNQGRRLAGESVRITR